MDIRYNKLRFLIADDFSAFRSTVNRMLLDLGVENVDAASTGEEVIERCREVSYDVVLCDYNLGNGRNGQQVLEELRYKAHLTSQSVFVLVSAESARNIVMSSYEAAPDDYLMKPITAQMLQTRLRRLLTQRAVFSPVYAALSKGNTSAAIDILIDMSIAENRYATSAQKMLGELFIQNQEYKKAEKLYMRVLEVRELDWARLGLAKAKSAQGDLEQAGAWFQRIIDDNYLYLPAYDALAQNWIQRGDKLAAQDVAQSSVSVSPMSILRQKNLANLASDNSDYAVAVEALRKVVKLGKQSCYGSTDDKLALARSVADAMESEEEIAGAAIAEASEGLIELNALVDLSLYENVKLKYISSRMNALRSKSDVALEELSEAERSLLPEDSTVDVEIDHLKALLALDYLKKKDDLLARLKDIYADDQEALEKLDVFFDEPVSAANKALVAEVNREGIDLYNNCQFDEALECFDKAIKVFPKHVGLQLNVVQALIGKLKASPQDNELHKQCRDALDGINSNIDESHQQYKRFLKLKNLAKGFYESV